jgi:hypothetical protein
MAVPLDAIRAIHNALRKDGGAIAASAYSAARGQGGMDLVAKRYIFLNEVLVWHADGEEEFVFPAMEGVAPLVAEAYERDHRGIDSLFDSLKGAMATTDVLAIARAAAVFDFHMSFHMTKEEQHLYRIFNERVPLPDQGAIMGKMAQKIPGERFAEFVSWLYPLLEIDDRENMVRIMRQALPAPKFSQATQLIKAAIGSEWQEITRRIPDIVRET